VPTAPYLPFGGFQVMDKQRLAEIGRKGGIRSRRTMTAEQRKIAGERLQAGKRRKANERIQEA
jgi:general stress protein YciG